MDDYELIDNEERHQYEFHIGKYVPKIEYIKTKNGENRVGKGNFTLSLSQNRT